MRGRSARTLIAATSLIVAAVLAACGSSDPATGPTTSPTTSPATDPVSGSITVLAATSLTAAFTDIGAAFHVLHPDASVTFSFGSSSSLATSIVNGAPADVFASADEKNMSKVTEVSAAATTPAVFTTNSLAIIVQPGNPKSITSVGDLARPDVAVATCSDEVPIRRYTDQMLAAAGVAANFVTFEANVGGIVTKVTSGAVDAGVVYRTDATAAGADAVAVPIPTNVNVTAQYPIAPLAAAANPSTAQAFVDFVQSAEAQKILASYGFGGE